MPFFQEICSENIVAAVKYDPAHKTKGSAKYQPDTFGMVKPNTRIRNDNKSPPTKNNGTK